MISKYNIKQKKEPGAEKYVKYVTIHKKSRKEMTYTYLLMGKYNIFRRIFMRLIILTVGKVTEWG